MAFQENQLTITLEAAADLSAKQYYFVAVDTDGKAALTGDDGNPIGVLQNKPTAGQAATICVYGVTKLYIGTESGLGAGYNVGCDSNSAGKVSDTGSFRMGVALEDPAADGDIVAVLLQKNGKQA
jgi:hypothetical protein